MKKQSKKMPELIIDREKWLRGDMSWADKKRFKKDEYTSSLYDARLERMCCLGFYCETKGVNKSAMSGFGWPHELMFRDNRMPELVGGEPRYGCSFATQLCDNIVKLNDDDTISEFNREARLKKKFKLLKVNLKFIGRSLVQEKRLKNKKYKNVARN